MPNIIFGGKIRSRQPESLSTSTQDCTSTEDVASLPTAPRARAARPRVVPVMRDEVMGLNFSQFPHLPPELWNHLGSAFRDSMREICVTLSEAYAAGIDESLSSLLDETIPAIVSKLGRESFEGLLCRERGFVGTTIRCHVCNDEARYHEDVPKSLVTMLGTVATRRSYYLCPAGHTFYPQDILLGVDGEHRILPSVQENVALLTSQMAYSKAVETMERLLHIDLSVETAERVTATVAGAVEKQQEAERREAFTTDRSQFPEPMTVSPSEVGIVGADGGYVRIRNQEEQREFKVGVLGTMEPIPGLPLIHPETGKKRKLPPTKDKFYCAHIDKVDDFFEHLTVEYFRRGLHRCSVVQFLADGANCYWKRFGDLVQPGQEAIFCLDFYHGMDYVRDAAVAIFGKDGQKEQKSAQQLTADGGSNAPQADKQKEPHPRQQGRPKSKEDATRPMERKPKSEQMTKPKEGTPQRQWYDVMGGHLLEGRLDAFFDELKLHQPTSAGDRGDPDPVQKAITYFDERRYLLRYKECVERGLPIGSGMIEGGIRFVAKDRLDRPGTKWTVPGAEAILQLRSLDASKRWHGFFANAATDRRTSFQRQKETWLQAVA